MLRIEGNTQQISLFRSLIQNRAFDDGTLGFLETLLISKDVKSLLDVRRTLRQFMTHESVCVLREINDKSVDHKLLVCDFFVRAYAIIGDLESCLALRYEALILREFHSVGDQQLRVSYREWVTFAEHALENRFHAIARKACEKALACFHADVLLKTEKSDTLSEDMEVIKKVKAIKDIATVRASSQSVQAQAVDYLKRKSAETDKVSTSVINEKGHSASVLFRNGIKKHNARKLRELQRR
ncbi:protein DOUBLE-STRAND BREAK FORMATION [Rutidosis leptorrhynchoides]|uniref:protein DOUBLE-STRAND BREAK FORMATION n=1 Tax=Rutidosis leptorrhynchoides TaxID=125765 RepID=UPI003A9966CC